jgi:hypothetical protein
MSYLEDIYSSAENLDIGFPGSVGGENIDMNIIRHKLYKSYDDNEALRMARGQGAKLAPFQESNCKRVLVFDEYSRDSEKENLQIHNNRLASPGLRDFDPKPPNPKFVQSPDYSNSNKYANHIFRAKQKTSAEIIVLRSEVDHLKILLDESQLRTFTNEKKVGRLEKEFLDFKTNVSNFLLSQRIDTGHGPSGPKVQESQNQSSDEEDPDSEDGAGRET